jgi:hypothetical protein
MSTRKENIREGIRLSRAKYRQKEVAAAFGCAEQTLSTFMSGGALGHELCDKAEEWLKKEGFWPKEQISQAKKVFISSTLNDAKIFRDTLLQQMPVTAPNTGDTMVQCPGCLETVPLYFAGKRCWACCFCGATLGHECVCGLVNDLDARFCKSCGKPLHDDIPVPSEPPRMSKGDLRDALATAFLMHRISNPKERELGNSILKDLLDLLDLPEADQEAQLDALETRPKPRGINTKITRQLTTHAQGMLPDPTGKLILRCLDRLMDQLENVTKENAALWNAKLAKARQEVNELEGRRQSLASLHAPDETFESIMRYVRSFTTVESTLRDAQNPLELRTLCSNWIKEIRRTGKETWNMVLTIPGSPKNSIWLLRLYAKEPFVLRKIGNIEVFGVVA